MMVACAHATIRPLPGSGCAGVALPHNRPLAREHSGRSARCLATSWPKCEESIVTSDVAMTKGHGQHAASPHEIPPAGWKDVLGRLLSEIGEDRLMLVAAGVTYYTLLALVPSLTAIVSLYGLFNDPATVNQQVTLLQGLLPQGGLQIVEDQLTRLTASGRTTLNFTLLISLVIALWSASAGINALFDAMNIVYDEKEKRNFFVRTGMALLFTLATIIVAIVFVAVVIAMPVVLGFLQLGGGFKWLVGVLAYVLMMVILSLGIATLYRWGPSRAQAKWRWLSIGSGVAVIGIIVISVLFSWYAANFGNYNATYGSLGALIGFLTWIWLTVTMLLIGAELNAEMEHQTAIDSTVGERPRPMGERGAYIADHVAAFGAESTPDGKGFKDPEKRAEEARLHQAPSRRVNWGTAALVVPAALVMSWTLKHRRPRP
jgi:membrane protein